MKTAWRAVGIVWLLNLINAVRLIGARAAPGEKPRGIDHVGLAFTVTMIVGTFVVLHYVLRAYSAARRGRQLAVTGTADSTFSATAAAAGELAGSVAVPPVRPVSHSSDNAERSTLLGRGALTLSLVSMNPINGVASILSALAAYWHALRDPSRQGGLVSATAGALISCAFMTAVWQIMSPLWRPECGRNLKQVGSVLAQFNRQRGAFPPELQTLVDAGLLTKSQVRCPLESAESEVGRYQYIPETDSLVADAVVAWCDSPRHGPTRPTITLSGYHRLAHAELVDSIKLQRALSPAPTSPSELQRLLKVADRVNAAAAARLTGDDRAVILGATKLRQMTLSPLLAYQARIEAMNAAGNYLPENLTSREKLAASRASHAECLALLAAARAASANISEDARRVYLEARLTPEKVDSMAATFVKAFQTGDLAQMLATESRSLEILGKRLEFLESAWGHWSIEDEVLTFESDAVSEQYNANEAKWDDINQPASNAPDTP